MIIIKGGIASQMHDKKTGDIFIYNFKFKNFSNLSSEEKSRVLSWRNDKRIRPLMLNKDEIPYKTHMEFISELKGKNDKRYYLVSYNGYNLGVTDFYNISDEQCSWGYYLDPDLIGKAYGPLLEYCICDIAFDVFNVKTLNCETLNMNASVIRQHSYFGFSKIMESDGVAVMSMHSAKWRSNRKKLKFLLSVLKV